MDDIMKPEQSTDQKTLDTPRHKTNSALTTWIILALLVGMGGGGVLVYFSAPYFKERFQIKNPVSLEVTPQETAKLDTIPEPIPAETGDVTSVKVEWLKQPIKLADLGFLEKSPTMNFRYYRVGTSPSGDVITALPGTMGPGYAPYVTFLQSEDKVTYVPSASSSVEYTTKKVGDTDDTIYLKVGIAFDATIMLEGSIPPKTIEYKGAQLTLWDNGSIDSFVEPEEQSDRIVEKTLQELKEGTLLSRSFTEPEGGFRLEEFVLRLPGYRTAIYRAPFDILLDDMVLSAVWSDGTKNGDSYRTDGAGSCGSSGMAILNKNPEASDLKTVGKTESGEPLYALKDLGNQAVDYFYENSSVKEGLYDRPKMTKQQFMDAHGLVVYKDVLGRYILLSNENYGPAVECGKPVVYLYPERETAVSVKVGAKIRKSEPEYNGGWNVTAYPGGRIESNGVSYPYLYWDGMGEWYPMLDEGVIVKRSAVEPTLRTQMTQLGLNTKEQEDFLEFWMEHMPSDPYVRLTWFDTHLMDRIAPLDISPKPDSILRVFLDFEGLQKPHPIREQKLSAPARKGFTAVEWGGLLRGE